MGLIQERHHDPNPFGVAVADALGLKRVRSLDIHCDIYSTIVTAKILTDEVQNDEVISIIKQFELVPLDEDSGIEPGCRD